MQTFLLKTTMDNEENASCIVNALLKQRLVGCAQIYKVKSNYTWEGSIFLSDEYVIEIQTILHLVFDVVTVIKNLHKYTLPEIVSQVFYAGKEYYEWMVDCCKKDDIFRQGVAIVIVAPDGKLLCGTPRNKTISKLLMTHFANTLSLP